MRRRAEYRWTYEYQDSEGIDRELVVDIAIGVGQTDDEDLLRVIQFNRFHSLDGVDWNDPVAKADLYVGRAILTMSSERETTSWNPSTTRPFPGYWVRRQWR